jgi:hypothetical protein
MASRLSTKVNSKQRWHAHCASNCSLMRHKHSLGVKMPVCVVDVVHQFCAPLTCCLNMVTASHIIHSCCG